MKTPVRVLIVEDSSSTRELLAHILGSDTDIEIAGFAHNGDEALAAVERLSPDVVTMDVNMPGMDGFTATRRIMESHPVPILIVTASANPGDVRQAFDVIEAGAVGLLEKPPGLRHPQHELHATRLISNVKIMSEVKVIRRRTRQQAPATPPPAPAELLPRPAGPFKVVAIGSSTGGPPALHTVLNGLKDRLTVPVLVVQHIASGFIGGLAEWLSQATKLPVHLAEDGMHAEPGHVYFAPDQRHLVLRAPGELKLIKDAPDGGVRPAVSCLFRSVTETYGQHAVGVLLTGMGRDGADELKLMHDAGAITFAQNAETSVVFGMPGEAIRLGGATFILSPERIAATIGAMLSRAPSSSSSAT